MNKENYFVIFTLGSGLVWLKGACFFTELPTWRMIDGSVLFVWLFATSPIGLKCDRGSLLSKNINIINTETQLHSSYMYMH